MSSPSPMWSVQETGLREDFLEEVTLSQNGSSA